MSQGGARLHRALDSADPAIRIYLLYGPDEAGARALAGRLGKALGADVERIDLSGDVLKSDPARLADEAASISMFGGKRWIRVDPAGDESVPAVAALLQAAAAGNPVALIGPNLRKDSKLVKLLQDADGAIVQACYPPEGRELDQLAIDMARSLGLDLWPDVAQRIARSCGGDRAILSSELDKLSLYLDAAPDRQRQVSAETLDALGAGIDEGDLSRLSAMVFGGDPAGTDSEIARLESEGIEGIPVLRALGRRALLLAQLRAQVAGGDSVSRTMETAGKAVFFKERDAVGRALGRWTPEMLATAVTRLAEAERQVKTPGFVGSALVNDEVLAITRAAARRR